MSLKTNTSAMVALQTLKTINTDLEATNNRVSTGYRINDAKDGAAYWSIATTTQSDNGALGAVKDALGLGKSSVDMASTGLNDTKSVLTEIKNLLVTASVADADRGKIQTEIESRLADLKSKADSTVISGSNWLSVNSELGGYNATKNVVASFSRTGDSVALQTIAIDTSSMKLYDANDTVHTAVDTAATTSQTAYDTAQATAQTTYDTDITAADDAYETAINTAQATYDASAQDQAALDAFNTAKTTATTTKTTAYTTAYDTRKTALETANTFAADLEGTGNVGLGIFDKVRVASNAAGFTTASSIADIDVSNLSGSEKDLATVANFMSMVDAALLDITDAATTLGSVTSRIESQTTFVGALIDANDRAIGTLIDADMEAESTKLKALQTQQQLAVQSLSIANSSSQSILSLFGN